jgi:hypothetical protein
MYYCTGQAPGHRRGLHRLRTPGSGLSASLSDAAEEAASEFDRVNAVNLRGVWAAQKHELRHMRAQDYREYSVLPVHSGR